MLHPLLVDQWLGLVDDGSACLSRFRSGTADVPLLERVRVFADQADAWMTNASEYVLKLAEVSLARAYNARRDFDKKRRTLVALLEELRDRVGMSKST